MDFSFSLLFKQVYEWRRRGPWGNRMEVYSWWCVPISSLSQVSAGITYRVKIWGSKLAMSTMLKNWVKPGSISKQMLFIWVVCNRASVANTETNSRVFFGVQYLFCSHWQWNPASCSCLLHFWLVTCGCVLPIQSRCSQHRMPRHLCAYCWYIWLCVCTSVPSNGWWSLGNVLSTHSTFIYSGAPIAAHVFE